MPEENVFGTGEEWEVELPGFGKMTVSLCVCLFACLLVCLFVEWEVEVPGFGKITVSLCVCLFACLFVCLLSGRWNCLDLEEWQ